MMPDIIQESNQGISRLPIQDILYQNREIFCVGEINKEVLLISQPHKPLGQTLTRLAQFFCLKSTTSWLLISWSTHQADRAAASPTTLKICKSPEKSAVFSFGFWRNFLCTVAWGGKIVL